MREISYIVIHCTATQPNQSISSIKKYWKEVLGWSNPGYHLIIDAFGKVHKMLPFDGIANGAKGYNTRSIHMAYIGGIDKSGAAFDTRTPEQSIALAATITVLKDMFLSSKIVGHRDLSPDLNSDGKITPDEFIKQCPSFDVSEWLKTI